eukprot:gene2030-5103_t
MAKQCVALSTQILNDDQDREIADLDFNIATIHEIQNSWVGASEPLVREGRVFVMEDTLSKMCRKGIKPRHFFLFNDILVYGMILGKRRYSKQHVLALSDISVKELPEGDYDFGFEIMHKRKSFHVYAQSQAQKDVWLDKLKMYIEKQASGRRADGQVVARAVWVPDSKVKKCMVCNITEFNMMKRRHHCRSCGKVVCATCSPHKAFLYKGKQERVCVVCFEKIISTGDPPQPDAPVLGSCENSSNNGRSKLIVSKIGWRKPKTTISDGSESSDSNSMEHDASADAIRKFVSGVSGTFQQDRTATTSSKSKGLSEAEKRLHTLSNQERLAVMTEVREGKMSIEDAIRKVGLHSQTTSDTSTSDSSEDEEMVAPPRPSRPPLVQTKGKLSQHQQQPQPAHIARTAHELATAMSSEKTQRVQNKLTTEEQNHGVAASKPQHNPLSVNEVKAAPVRRRRRHQFKQTEPAPEETTRREAVATPSNASTGRMEQHLTESTTKNAENEDDASSRQRLLSSVSYSQQQDNGNNGNDSNEDGDDTELKAARQRRLEREERRRMRHQHQSQDTGFDSKSEIVTAHEEHSDSKRLEPDPSVELPLPPSSPLRPRRRRQFK